MEKCVTRERELLQKVIQDTDDGVMSLGLYKEVTDYLSQPEQTEPEPIAWKVVDSIGEFMFSSVKPMKRSYKYDLIIPLYDSINDNSTFGDISMHTDEELDEHFRNRIDVYAEKHPTLLVRQLAERLRKEWNKIEEPEQEPVAWVFPSDLKRFETQETTAVIYSVEMGKLSENSIPLYTKIFK